MLREAARAPEFPFAQIGPNMDPWGTPDRTGFEDDLMPFKITLCYLSPM